MSLKLEMPALYKVGFMNPTDFIEEPEADSSAFTNEAKPATTGEDADVPLTPTVLPAITTS